MSYSTYPFIPLLLVADSKEDIDRQYETLNKTLSIHHNIKKLALELAERDNSGCYRGVAIFNEKTKKTEMLFEGSILSEVGELKKPPVVFMFAGIGNQYKNIAAGLYKQIPFFKDLFDECCCFLEPILELDLKKIVFDEEKDLKIDMAGGDCKKGGADLRILLSKSKTASAENILINKTKYLHPLLFVVEYCLAKTLMKWGIVPKAMIGHSVGEYAAAAVAGVLSQKDALLLIAKRALLIEKLQPGCMLTVLAGKEEIEPLLNANDRLFLATENSPISCTISGSEKDIVWAEEELEEKDVVFFRLPTDRAFHSPLLEPIKNAFEKTFENIAFHLPKIPYLSNLTGDWATERQIFDAHSWFLHTCKTVRFSEGIQKLLDIKDCIFVEIGPGQTLTGFVYQHPFKDDNSNVMVHSALKNVNDSTPDTVYLLHILCKLWGNGVPVDWNSFFK
ncbi:acyltransferase domain-containing protein [Marinisporobacter balticus]|uniref:Acyl transferase family protein n=1 Tax=Marinisporobacter balticus TaxID=2018667 RepID=A0A4R2KIM5_9FIRM|nr:acyltransferase domain-containing protein [Marinisporobacter balticus]TCO70409.1 acyl transferase family protein [Marinisporobacter balticus]